MRLAAVLIALALLSSPSIAAEKKCAPKVGELTKQVTAACGKPQEYYYFHRDRFSVRFEYLYEGLTVGFLDGVVVYVLQM